jgi:hypothetical protein
VLAACNAGQNVSPNVGAGSNFRLAPARIIFNHGGKFTAAYSGAYTWFGDCSGTRMFDYKGDGHARPLHSSTEQIKFTWYCGTRNVTGLATLTSVQVPRDGIAASVSSTDFMGPCYGFTLSFTITGGTGRFRRASGFGTIVVNGHSGKCSSYSYSDKWRGTLKP